jgi:DNA-binding NarL/FixJ family response regulator
VGPNEPEPSAPLTVLYVVILSADARPSLIQELLDRGVRAFLTKPLDVRELLELLDSVAAEQQPTGALPGRS